MSRKDSQQQQFLDVIDRDEAESRWRAAFVVEPVAETVSLCHAHGRILFRDVVSTVDVPGFDRSNLDGFAVRAADTWGADEEQPAKLHLLDEVIATAVVPQSEVHTGQAVSIATGGMLPRGADAIAMVEYTDVVDGEVHVYKPLTPGQGLTFAGTDISQGEMVYRAGEPLTSRETGVLAAIGVAEVVVFRRPKVGILSTGDEVIEVGQRLRPGCVFDSNAQVLADAVAELGGEPIRYGIVADDLPTLRQRVLDALEECDLVLLSGGTSKGAGDMSYRVLDEFSDPGIVAHGVALKPGKPICLAATRGKPIVILPGFPTSAIFTFHEFVATVIAEMAGRSCLSRPARAPDRGGPTATMATPVNSEIGRTEYLLVGLVRQGDSQQALSAYPMGKGSGAVTSFARADGFVTIDRHTEILTEGESVRVQLLGEGLQVADLVVIGSHCVGLDYLLSQLQKRGLRSKFLAVGSTAGLRAVQRGEADIAGIHLLDPKSDQYNLPFLDSDLQLLTGYGRRQGIVFRRGDRRFEDKELPDLLGVIRNDPTCVMVNRNQGSGTRVLIDQWLEGHQPSGYAVQARNHNAVAVSVEQQRSDWGMAIETVARRSKLGFVPLRQEKYDFVIRRGRQTRGLQLFQTLLAESDVRQSLSSMGFLLDMAPGD